VGDLNIVESLDPLNTIITGNIFNEATYGADSPPDWDGTSLADAHPLHNGVGPDDYTWREDSSIYDPGRLDYVLYTDSVVSTPTRFLLNTTTMTPAQLAATGLQALDSANSPGNFDHLPLVIDFRFPAPGDYNSDGAVDGLDYVVWRSTLGRVGNMSADGSGNAVVDAADYVVWRNNLGAGSSAASSAAVSLVPEPTSLVLAIAAALCACHRRFVRASICRIGAIAGRL